VDKGSKRVDEDHYKTGAGKSVGSRSSVAALIGDSVKRVFQDATELEDYANGKTDYIGDVKTKKKGTFWFRLPKDQLTVLGEAHHDEEGNFEDVVKGLRTSRFMYEPFNELAATTALAIPYTGTQTRLDQVNKGIGIAGFADRAKFDPDLENIVIKALTGTSILRNEFIPGKPMPREDAQWKKRPDKDPLFVRRARGAVLLLCDPHRAGRRQARLRARQLGRVAVREGRAPPEGVLPCSTRPSSMPSRRPRTATT
jgi:hypothetical protein